MVNSEISEEHRRAERVPVALPLSIANINGITCDISLTGISFEAVGDFALGQIIDFAIQFGNHGGNLMLKCKGEIVRMERKQESDKVHVGVKIADSILEPAS